MPEHEPQPFEECAICGRTILRGERVVEFLTPDGESRAACALCKERAEDAGWVRADGADAHRPAPPRRRRRLRGLNLRERAGRLAERARPPRPEDTEPERGEPFAPKPPPPAAEEPAPAPVPEPPPPPETPERRVRRGLERFNDSERAKMVSGLIKPLGAPQAAVRELTDPARIEVTVAWDLSWYRWEVALEGDGEPKEVGKGSEVSELEGEEVDWNATVGDEGKVRWQEGS